MNQQDLNELTNNWHSDTNWLNEKIDDMFKQCQDHAYALGLSRGLHMRALSDSEILDTADPFGAFEFGDSQGDKRIAFARAILARAALKAAEGEE